MITKQGNAMFKGVIRGIKNMGKSFFKSKPSVPKVPKAPKPNTLPTPTAMQKAKDFGKEFVSQTLMTAPLDALALYGGASAGSIIGGNATGALTGRLITPLTNKIKGPRLRWLANTGAALSGDIAGGAVAEKYMPIWRRKIPEPFNENDGYGQVYQTTPSAYQNQNY